MALERHCLSLDLYCRVTFGYHAIMMTSDRASAPIADAGNGPSHHNRFVLPRHDLAAVAGSVTEPNYSTHALVPCILKLFKWASTAVILGPCRLDRLIRRAHHHNASHSIWTPIHRHASTTLVVTGDQPKANLHHG